VTWLRKGTVRLAGRRRRSSSVQEFDETREELGEVAFSYAGSAQASAAYGSHLLPDCTAKAGSPRQSPSWPSTPVPCP